jgi:hypothetical protein
MVLEETPCSNPLSKAGMVQVCITRVRLTTLPPATRNREFFGKWFVQIRRNYQSATPNKSHTKFYESFNNRGTGGASADTPGTRLVLRAVAAQTRAHRGSPSSNAGWSDCLLSPDPI